MAGVAKTVGSTMLAMAALPVAGISALVGFFALMEFLFGQRTFGFLLTFLVCAALVYFPLRFAWRIWKRSEQFVQELNQKHGLQLMPNLLLGVPSPVFLAFDQVNRKFAFCNIATGDCRIEDFTKVLGWRYEWRNSSRMEMSGIGGTVPGTRIMTPAWEMKNHRSCFTVIVEVADPNYPEFHFPMLSESQASQWCARLNAIFNGR